MFKELQKIEEERKKAGIDKYVVQLDHLAYRVKMGEKEKFMAEVMNVLPFKQYKTFQVPKANAITTSIKLFDTLPVIVISEGLSKDSIVEKYCQKYGSRVHHLAYEVTNIDEIVKIQQERGIEFTTEEIIGSEPEGIKQIFTKPTESTNHIIEYIQRFGDFDGFFTPSNIENLMKSTQKLGEA
ncbi:MAG: VOC family protein [Asgard group archaeon]|nr:VOC family protein [Asgard group archaeon]